jgi:hypothetical protein
VGEEATEPASGVCQAGRIVVTVEAEIRDSPWA